MQNSSKLLLFVMLVFVILSFAACKKEIKGDVLSFSLSTPISTLDPRLMHTHIEGHLARQIYEGLTVLDENLNPQPAVAERWVVSEDNLCYTFYLRPDAKWSNGDKVTAYDFVYAWKTALDPEFASSNVSMLFYIKNAKALFQGEAKTGDLGVRAVDQEILEIKLEHPVTYFPLILATTIYSPVHKTTVANNIRWARNVKSIICNGAYFVNEWSVTKPDLLLSKNPYYWQKDKVQIENIKCLYIEDAKERLKKWQEGELDIVQQVPALDVQEKELLTRMGNFQQYPLLGTYFYFFNVKKPPFDQLAVRQAVAVMLNREEIAKKAGLTLNRMTCFMLPKFIEKEKESKENVYEDYNFKTSGDLTGDVVRAKKMLTALENNLKSKNAKIELLYNINDFSNKMVAEEIADQMQSIGFLASASLETWQNLYKRYYEGDFLIGRRAWIAEYAEPMALLENFAGDSENNFTGWSNQEFDELLLKAKSSLHFEQRMLLTKQAEDILLKEAVVLPLTFEWSNILLSNRVKGFKNNVMDYFYFKKFYLKAD